MIIIRKEELQASAYDGEKIIGQCQYREEGDVWTIYHTYVDKEYGGQKIAGRLLESVVKSAREKGKKIFPECSYVRHVFEKDTEKYADIISKI
ncbi:MAG: GNAT family N-acetyltransferase [Candidatus Ornithospirochaeta sp.]